MILLVMFLMTVVTVFIGAWLQAEGYYKTAIGVVFVGFAWLYYMSLLLDKSVA